MSLVFGATRRRQSVLSLHGIERYMAVAQQLHVDLTKGYLFRLMISIQGSIVDAPFASSSAEARLKIYLQ